jgi:hypothetical protein
MPSMQETDVSQAEMHFLGALTDTVNQRGPRTLITIAAGVVYSAPVMFTAQCVQLNTLPLCELKCFRCYSPQRLFR